MSSERPKSTSSIHSASTESEGAAITSLQFSVRNKVGVLEQCLAIFRKHNLNLKKIESRPSTSQTADYDFYVEFDSTDDAVVEGLQQALLQEAGAKTQIIGRIQAAERPWFPQKIADLDKFVHRTLQYGEELDSDHPGFTDEEYRQRRRHITNIASNYRHGQEIPRVEYTQQENETWGAVYRKLKELYPTHACQQHNYILPLLEQNCGYGPESIPQLQDISMFLKECTGWSLRPVAGLLSPRDFLNGLAFRVFHSTQYIRHHSKPFYTPEPDVCHELLGHVPLFCDPAFAEFSQEVGLASLGASDDDITKLATCYWFTVEFGLCKEDGAIKAFGAGLLSSFGELEYCLSGKPELAPFDPPVTAQQEYPITKYQPKYFVAESFESAKLKLREYASTLDRPFDIAYNPFTQRVEVLDSISKVQTVMKHLHSQMGVLTRAMTKLS